MLKFVTQHLYDAAEREAHHGHEMPADVEAMLRSDGCLRTTGPQAPSTVRRHLVIWSTCTGGAGSKAPSPRGASAPRSA